MVKMKVVYKGNLHAECTHESGAKIQTDAPKDNQGKGEAFSPTDLFAASLATCMLTVMAIAARKVGADLEGMTLDIDPRHVRSRMRSHVAGNPSAPTPDIENLVPFLHPEVLRHAPLKQGLIGDDTFRQVDRWRDVHFFHLADGA